MTQEERRLYLIKELLKEQSDYSDVKIPRSAGGQEQLLRSLLNIRLPCAVSREFLRVQDEYLKAEIDKRGITEFDALEAVRPGLYIWQGDITTLRCDAVVNAANSRMLGCFVPCHNCIDNAIHTFSGVQLRLKCHEIMTMQGHEEPVGGAKITPAYNLPCKYVLHTVGPIVYGELTKQNCTELRLCYTSCLELAERNNVRSIAFCCISTGEFHFPNKEAAEIAVSTVMEYKERTNSSISVIFNVFKDLDFEIYSKLLSRDKCVKLFADEYF